MGHTVHHEFFEWNIEKEKDNRDKHKVGFLEAIPAFKDTHRIILSDEKHSNSEERWFCIGAIDTRILTVRFVIRNSIIRIIGAGHWRKGEKIYEKAKKKKN